MKIGNLSFLALLLIVSTANADEYGPSTGFDVAPESDLFSYVRNGSPSESGFWTGAVPGRLMHRNIGGEAQVMFSLIGVNRSYWPNPIVDAVDSALQWSPDATRLRLYWLSKKSFYGRGRPSYNTVLYLKSPKGFGFQTDRTFFPDALEMPNLFRKGIGVTAPRTIRTINGTFVLTTEPRRNSG
jgi:hypothetical protein